MRILRDNDLAELPALAALAVSHPPLPSQCDDASPFFESARAPVTPATASPAPMPDAIALRPMDCQSTTADRGARVTHEDWASRALTGPSSAKAIIMSTAAVTKRLIGGARHRS